MGNCSSVSCSGKRECWSCPHHLHVLQVILPVLKGIASLAPVLFLEAFHIWDREGWKSFSSLFPLHACKPSCSMNRGPRSSSCWALSLSTPKWLPFYLMVAFPSHCVLKITHSWVTFQYPRGSLALYSRQISSPSTLMELSVISSTMASGSLPLTQSIVRRFLIHRDTVKANKPHYNEFLTAARVPDLTWPWCNSTQTSSRSRCLQPKQPMPRNASSPKGTVPTLGRFRWACVWMYVCLDLVNLGPGLETKWDLCIRFSLVLQTCRMIISFDFYIYS